MISEGEVGIHVGADGTDNPLRLGKLGALVTTDGHGRYTETTWRGGSPLNIGGMFSACNQAAVTFGAGLSATVATLSLSNDIGSNKVLHVVNAAFAFSAAPAAATIISLAGLYATSNVTHTTPVIVRSNYLNSSSAASCAGKADSAATLPTIPVYLMPLIAVTGAAALTPAAVNVDLAGQIAIPPGGYIVFQATAAASGLCSLTWEELPIPT